MVKANLVTALHKEAGCSREMAQQAATFTIDWITRQIASGKTVELRGLGTFSTVIHQGGSNNLPNNKKKPFYAIKFKPGKTLKAAVRELSLKL